jgi:hypothetical protein
VTGNDLGDRMQAALAEMALEDLTKDAEDDKDFVIEKCISSLELLCNLY